MGRCGSGDGEGITGFSLSLPRSDTSAFSCLAGAIRRLSAADVGQSASQPLAVTVVPPADGVQSWRDFETLLNVAARWAQARLPCCTAQLLPNGSSKNRNVAKS